MTFKNASSDIFIKDELIKSEERSNVVSKVDALGDQYHLREKTSAPRKAPDSIADIQRKLLAIVGTQVVKDIEEDPDFEEVVDDDEDTADDLGEEHISEETDEDMPDTA